MRVIVSLASSLYNQHDSATSGSPTKLLSHRKFSTPIKMHIIQLPGQERKYILFNRKAKIHYNFLHKIRCTGEPKTLSSQLLVNSSLRSRSTRQDADLALPRARTESGRRRLLFGIVQLYNRLPPEMRNLSLGGFNTRTGKGGADSALPSCFLRISFKVFVRSP